MFHALEAIRFRCLRDVVRPLDSFHVLVGPNASGKTTFLDVVQVLSELVSEGLDSALDARTGNFADLTWARRGAAIELALEARVPAHIGANGRQKALDAFRYEVAIGLQDGSAGILRETGLLKRSEDGQHRPQRNLFPDLPPPRDTLFSPKQSRGQKFVFSKRPGQDDNYYPESKDTGGWVPAFKLGPRRSTLANLPEDESRFPAATWFKQLLINGVQRIVLNSLHMRRPSPPGRGSVFLPDGSNLPWVIESLRTGAPDRFEDWLNHIRTALPDIADIKTIERPEDKHRYISVTYAQGIENVPSWMVSDGTLRLLALTLPAYLPDFSGVYLIEEPENGIHPRAVETVFQSLSSVYGAQILLATHSQVILSVVEPERVLCFAKTGEGATDIVRGDQHPSLRDWRKEENLGVLFAAGVLG